MKKIVVKNIDERNALIKKMADKRMPYGDIGKLVGISKQRVHQIYMKPKYAPWVYPPIPAKDHKILTPAKRELLGIPENPIKKGQIDRVREWVRMRDKRTCQICLKEWKPGERRFDVHHLDEERESTRDCQWDLKNQNRMITLCHKCHMNLDSVRKKISVRGCA